ncbi:MAG: acyl-CoA dehydrogenase [Flammeovirgaceae bacterium]
MATKYIDIETLKFILYNVHDLDSVLAQERYAEYDKESIDMFLNSVKDFSDRELHPYFKEMDEKPAVFKDGKVVVHPQVAVMMKKGGEMGFISAVFDYEDGGLQLPFIAHTAAGYIQETANNHLPGYTGLTQGAAELIIHFANQELKDTYVPNMLSGEWGGTMCLTEPQAGSSLSDVATSAVPTDEGYYQITGQKIFISGGDHQYSENFVHLLLGRIKGAPAGTKGISLFVVPQHRPEGGGLVSNDVITASDFEKMGQKGYCTTHLIFGEQEDCRGWLVGEANQGLKYMFMMMNGARISVGRGGAAIAMAAYQASLAYAKERPQGRKVGSSGDKDVSKGQSLIIEHADVRRMLLLQKAISEGALSLVLKAAKYHDLKITHADEDKRKEYDLLLELLTPMVKTFPAEFGLKSVTNGLQVLGGYGFCTEYILQQYYRDIRIFSIYEGTTGIQSMDLLGRKIPMAGGAALKLLSGEIMQVIQSASNHEELKPYAGKLGKKLQQVQEVLGHLSKYAKQGDFQRYLADANIFMEFFSHITISWLLLEMAEKAKTALMTGDKTYSEAFYESKVQTMKFYFKYELTQTNSLAEILMDEESLTIDAGKEVFV